MKKGNFMKRMAYSEITASLEVLASLGVDERHLELIRKDPRYAREVAKAICDVRILSYEALKIHKLQVDHLKALGYRDVENVPYPDENKLKMGLAILVDYETSIPEQCNYLHILNHMDMNYYIDLINKPQSRWGWIYDVKNITRSFGISSEFVMPDLEKNGRRGLITVEGLALYREDPADIRQRYSFISFPGSGSKYNKVITSMPSLYLVDSHMNLHYLNNDKQEIWASCLL